MTYLDNAATSFPKPSSVHEGASSFIQALGANPGRGGHRMAAGASRMVEATRLALARLINAAATPERVVFAHNCTDALNMAIKGALQRRPHQGSGVVPHVITSVLEHNSVSRPLEQLASDGVITLTRLGSSVEGYLSADDVAQAFRRETRLVALTHGSNVLGTIQPIAEIGAVVRERGDGRAWFLVDAAQTIGVEAIDVEASHIDLLAFPGHKALLGYPGTGGLYVAPHVELQPWREGGTGGDSRHPVQPSEYPHRLEGGTHNTIGIASLKSGLDFIAATGAETIRQHESMLATRLLDGLAQVDGVTIHGPRHAARRVATVPFNVTGYTSQDVGAILDSSFDIAVRPGLHCSPYCHRLIGTFPDGAVRASVGYFNTAADVDALLDAVARIATA